MIGSTGRCGSTLVSRAFHQADDAVSFSEPDAYMQLQVFRALSADPAEVRALLSACTRLLCAGASLHKGARLFALKLRSYGIELADLFYQLFPTAKAVFLYRHAETWARSAADSPRPISGRMRTMSRSYAAVNSSGVWNDR